MPTAAGRVANLAVARGTLALHDGEQAAVGQTARLSHAIKPGGVAHGTQAPNIEHGFNAREAEKAAMAKLNVLAWERRAQMHSAERTKKAALPR